MRKARKVSNINAEVNFKQDRLAIAFIGNTFPHRKQSRKSAEDSIVDKIACHQHATLPKLNSQTAPPRKHKITKTKICTATPLNRNLLHIEAKNN